MRKRKCKCKRRKRVGGRTARIGGRKGGSMASMLNYGLPRRKGGSVGTMGGRAFLGGPGGRRRIAYRK